MGLVPENTNISLYTANAFNIPIGAIAILMLSIAVLHNRQALAVTGLVTASIGLIEGCCRRQDRSAEWLESSRS